MLMNKVNERVTIAGFGGQGVMLIGQILAYAGNEAGKKTLWYPSYGPETRGGTANCAVTISDDDINSPVFSKANTVIAMNLPSLEKFYTKVLDDGCIIYNSSLIKDKELTTKAKVYKIPANEIALELGNSKVANMVILGAYLEITKLFNDDIILNVLKKLLGAEKEHLLDINKKALKVGRDYLKKEYKL